jgi:glycosyltransferase involved in cell wall biosynthesis
MTAGDNSSSVMAGSALPMRILHLNSLLRGGGTDDQCVKLVHGLAQLGHEVWLAGPGDREFSKTARDLGIPFHATPPEGPLKLRFIASVAGLVRSKRIQILHGHHGRDLWPTVLAARLSGCRPKIVVTRHMAKSPSSRFSRRFLLNRCDAMIAVSQFVARVLREGVYEPHSPEPERRSRPPLLGDHSRIHVVYGGIDADRFRPFDAAAQRAAWGLAPEHFAFITVGSYDLPRGKGQREFLQAAALVREQLPHARFLVVGRGNMKEILQADIVRLNLQDCARLTPYCQDMPQLMNALDCLVHGQVGTEAFALVLLEAFACGKPVIASALDGIPEAFAFGNYGRLVPPENVAALAGAMVEQARQLAMGAAERQRLHREIAERASLYTMAAGVEMVYRKIMPIPGPESFETARQAPASRLSHS